jgi:dTMP kinase
MTCTHGSKLLENYLKTKNISCKVTREPGGTKLGERVREILLNNDGVDIDPMTELLLMFSARAQHLKDVIYPALKENTWVLCDRFTDASYAYQGGGRGLSFPLIKRIESSVQNNFRPDLTILLSGDIQEGMQRVSNRGKKDRFELEKLEFFERVRSSYLKLAKASPERFSIVDADQKIDKAALAIQAAVNRRFAELMV